MSKDEQVLTTQEKLNLKSWGLPKLILQKYVEKGITTMFPWQVECLCLPNVLLGGNLVYSAPTSAGKTLVAEILTIQTIIERRKKAFFILPFISVVREKMLYFKDLLKSSGVRVHGFMGSHSPPGGIDACNLAVCTIEKANGLINRLIEENSLEDVGCVVVDELHLLGDPHRGYLLELLLAKLRYVSKRESLVKVQIVGMSATLPNLTVLADWLDAALYSTDFRPVPLTEYLKVESVIYRASDMDCRSITLPEFDIKDDPGSIMTLCIDAILSGHSALVFCPSKNWCETLAQQIALEICKMGSTDSDLGAQLKEQLNSSSISDVLEQLKRCPVGLEVGLRRSVSFGVGYHHAGLTMDEREILESAFRGSVLRVLVATSTLSSGVNLPARRVIVRSPLFAGRPLDILTYKQMIGRAGRMGRDTAGESFLLCKESEKRVGEGLVKGQLPAVQSCLGLGDLSSSLKRAVLEVIASGVVSSLSDVEEYTSCTLFAACHKTESSNRMDEPIAACINFLKNHEFIKVSDDGLIAPTSLGEACLSAALPPDQALRLLSELYRARQCFVLDSELHIIYQVTPFSVSEQWRQMDWMSAFALWEGLSPSMQRVGELVGVEERFLVRAIRGNINTSSSDQMEKLSIFRRFYTALALQDLVNEVPLVKVSEKFKCSKGMLQSLQQSSSTFAGMVTQFCKRLGWSSMELLISQFADRLHFGVHRELIDLLRIDCISAVQARALYNAKITTLTKLASAKGEKVEKALRNAVPFESNKIESATNDEGSARKHIWLTGRSGVTEREGANLIIREAREFLQAELGLETAKWTEECSLNDFENELQTSLINSNLEEDIEEGDKPDDGSLTQFQERGENLNLEYAVESENQSKPEKTGDEGIVEEDTVLVNDEGDACNEIITRDEILNNSNILEPRVEEELSKTVPNNDKDYEKTPGLEDREVSNEDQFNVQVENEVIKANKNEGINSNEVEVSRVNGDEGIEVNEDEVRVGSSVAKVDMERENKIEKVRSHQNLRHSLDLFESSCESSGFNLEYTITPPPSSPASKETGIENEELDENFELLANAKAVNIDYEDVDMFEINESDGNENVLPIESKSNLFPTQDDVCIRDFNLSGDLFVKQDATHNNEDSKNDSAKPDAQLVGQTIFDSQYEADTVLVDQTSQSSLSKAILKSNSPFNVNNMKVSTPLSNVNLNRGIHLFQHSPICDDRDIANEVRNNSLEDMDSNWGGESILESSLFFLSVVETKKRKLPLPDNNSVKRFKTSNHFEANRKDEIESLNKKTSLETKVEHDADQAVEPIAKKRKSSLFDSMTVDTQLFNALDVFAEPIPSKLKTPPFEKLTQKTPGFKVNGIVCKEVLDCSSVAVDDDDDFIAATPKHENQTYKCSSINLPNLFKTRTKPSTVVDDDDFDTISGTPAVKCSSLNKLSSLLSKSTLFPLSNKCVEKKDSPSKKTIVSDESVVDDKLSEKVKETIIRVKPPVVMGPPPLERPIQKVSSSSSGLDTVDTKNRAKLFPELDLKCIDNQKVSPSNEVSISLLEAAAEMQSLYEFDNETMKKDLDLCTSNRSVRIDNSGLKRENSSTSGSSPDWDDYVISSQEDVSIMSSSVQTRAMSSKTILNGASTSSVSRKISQSPSNSKFVHSPSKKITSPVNKKTQLPSLSVTTEYVCSDGLKLRHFEKELEKNRVFAISLDVKKQGETRSGKTIGARIMGNRTITSDAGGDFCSGQNVIIGIAIYWGDAHLYYLDIKKSDCSCVPIIRKLFSKKSITLVIYDMKTNLKLLKECMAIDLQCEGSDPIVADWMLTPFSRCRSFHNIFKNNSIKCPQYDCNAAIGVDTIKLWSLSSMLEKKLKQADILFSYKSVEMPVQFTLGRMEIIGFKFDREYAELLMDRVQIKMSELQETAFQIAGRKFNPRSKTDLNKVLQTLGFDVSAHEGIDVLSEIVKKWGKLNTLKTKSLSPILLESGSRIYGCYTTCTQTGRVSMKLQNVPKDLLIDDEVFSLRTAFIPSPGAVLISSDYCQLELRLLAHLSQDATLLEAFRTCDDVFISIAASWRSIPESQVTDEMRQHTKQICYGLIYGMGVTSLAEQLELSEDDAREMMRSFEEAYPALQSYLTKVVAQCQTTKHVRTILNRVRYLPDIVSKNSSLKSQAERQAVNTTVQGSAADIAKLGMLKVEKKLLELCPGSNILLQLHDELIYEVPEIHLENAVAIIRKEMENTKSLSVPLPVKIRVGPSWGQLVLYNSDIS